MKRPYEAKFWPAKVLLIDVQTAEVRSTTVEAELDRFTFDGVKPGVYHVVAAGIKCFKGVPRDVVVKAGAVHRVTVKLKFDSHLCEVVVVE
ncbi:MAG TPA: carboxypeptidase-like regulatory domain-containing protein [Terriglobales bacterium]|nr:carboxypeptidase-like regulatory domain-containing protein [Terriglobales bacterium]